MNSALIKKLKKIGFAEIAKRISNKNNVYSRQRVTHWYAKGKFPDKSDMARVIKIIERMGQILKKARGET